MKPDGVFLAGTGAWVPEVMPAKEAVRRGLYDAERCEWYGWTGAAVAGDTPAPDMAVRAGRQAISRSGVRPGDIGLHLHACGHEQGPEGWSAQHYILRGIAHPTAVGDRVTSIRLWQSCNGLLAAMELAAAYLNASPMPSALITGADNLGTPNINRWAIGLQNGIVGDGASAVVLSRNGGFARLLSINSASLPDIEHLYRGNEPLFPPSLTIGRHLNIKERMDALQGESMDLLEEVVSLQSELRTSVALKTLAEANISAADVARVAHVFTGQESYLRSILDPIGISIDRGLLEFGRAIGHLTVNDQVVGLNYLLETHQVSAGDYVLLIAHGGGTSLTCAAIRVETCPAWQEEPTRNRTVSVQ